MYIYNKLHPRLPPQKSGWGTIKNARLANVEEDEEEVGEAVKNVATAGEKERKRKSVW